MMTGETNFRNSQSLTPNPKPPGIAEHFSVTLVRPRSLELPRINLINSIKWVYVPFYFARRETKKCRPRYVGCRHFVLNRVVSFSRANDGG
jgi:hypothetical protein